MARSKTRFPRAWRSWSLGDLLNHLGSISPERVRLDPQPGTATERHVTKFNDHEDRLYELVDGVLVEKVLGLQKSYVGVEIGSELGNFVEQHDLGIILGAGGTMRLRARPIRGRECV
jgi:hypothetical protein